MENNKEKNKEIVYIEYSRYSTPESSPRLKMHKTTNAQKLKLSMLV